MKVFWEKDVLLKTAALKLPREIVVKILAK